jgi:hypothetical protein
MIKDKNEWRYDLKVGDLVMMKHGGMAVITDVRHHRFDDPDEWPFPPPHIGMTYCDDGEHGSCSSYRIERMLSETG